MSYYAIPDIHGNLKGLKKAVNSILPEFNDEVDKIIFLGDYIDRGFESLEVIQFIMNLQNKHKKDSIIALLGNHEDMFLNWIKNPLKFDFLLNDYKLRTLSSFYKEYFSLCSFTLNYSYEIIDLNSGKNYTKDIINFIKKTYPNEIEWLKNLPKFYDRIEQDNVLFIHAGIEEVTLGADWKTYTSENTMIWKYPISYGVNPFGFSIVSGHVMVDELWKFSEKPCYDIFVTGNHYYLDGASPIIEKLNILKIQNNSFIDFNNNIVLD